MDSELAEIVALKALAWLAAQDDFMERFCATSGLSPADLMSEASNSETLGGLLDFMLGDEEILRSFCTDEDIYPDTPLLARAALPGGNTPHWT